MSKKYAYAFKQADENRKIVGLPSIYSQFNWKDVPSLINKKLILENDLKEFINESYMQGGNCLVFHYQYLKFIQENIDPLATLTMGYLEHNGSYIFKFSTENIKKWYKYGLLSTENQWELNLHVWITLSNLEIIDLTLPFALIKLSKNNHKLDYYPFLFGNSEKNEINTTYHPIIIGNDYIQKIIKDFLMS